MEPIEPGDTCPRINEAIRLAEFISKEADNIGLKVADITSEADDIVSELEDIRSENEFLRDWGQYWKDKYEELEKEKNNDL